MISLILLIAAIVALAMATVNFPSTRISLFPLGMLFWALSVIVNRL